MTDELKIRYRLYALSVDKNGMEQAAEQRFSRITPFYILVYVNGDAPEGAVEITQTETHRLSKQDERWLLDCNVVILAEAARKHEKDIAADMSRRLDRLEAALKHEMERMEG